MSGKRTRNRTKTGFFSDNFYQSASYNTRCYQKNIDWILSLAINRFVWNGLPETCNTRKLEETLLRNGSATIAKDNNGVWFSLNTGSFMKYNVYMEPVEWQVIGFDGTVQYNANTETGVIVYDNMQKIVPFNTLDLMARELTQVERTLQVNRAQQHTPIILKGKREQKQALYNFAKQISGFETCVLADESFNDNIQVESIKLDIPYIAEELWSDRANAWNEIYRFLGIPHLSFEKNERMIEQEAEANASPAGLMAMNELTTRKEAAKKLSDIMGSTISVEWNKDAIEYAQTVMKSMLNTDKGGNDNGSLY